MNFLTLLLLFYRICPIVNLRLGLERLSTGSSTDGCAISDFEDGKKCDAVYNSIAGQEAQTTGKSSDQLCLDWCKTKWSDWLDDYTDLRVSEGETFYDEDHLKSRGCCRRWGTDDNCKAYLHTNTNQNAFPDTYYIQLTAQSNSKAMLLTESCAKTTDVGGDPHITNMNGQSFDILQAGTFSLLSLRPKKTLASGASFLDVNIMISRIAEECSEAYIQNATLSGTWITALGYSLIQIRGQPSFLEVAVDGNWQSATAINSKSFKSSSPKKLTMNIEKIALEIDIQNWNKKATYDGQARVHDLGWSFLNMKFTGLFGLGSDVDVRGLLGYDDFSSAAKLPQQCTKMTKGEHSTQFLSSVSIVN